MAQGTDIFWLNQVEIKGRPQELGEVSWREWIWYKEGSKRNQTWK